MFVFSGDLTYVIIYRSWQTSFVCSIIILLKIYFTEKNEFIQLLRFGGWQYFIFVTHEWFFPSVYECKGILNLQRHLFLNLLLLKFRDIWSFAKLKMFLTYMVLDQPPPPFLIAKFKGGRIFKYNNWLNIFFFPPGFLFRNYWQSKTYSRLWDMTLLFSN